MEELLEVDGMNKSIADNVYNFQKGRKLMETSNKVSIREIIKELKLKVVYMPDDVDYYVYSQDINRPGLQFAGYFDYFAYERIQIVGKTEYNFLD